MNRRRNGNTSLQRIAALCAATAMLTACAGAPAPRDSTSNRAFALDRAAILAMAGDFRVSFRFDETVALRPDYAFAKPHRSAGYEMVRVVEDTGPRIVLQHILVSPKGQVVKHWRQDWQWQDSTLWEFRGERVWSRRDLAPTEARGRWSQAVYEVDDSPRYESIGRWTHANGSSSWTSDKTWRPLPRREFTTRSDYDVLIGTNRHTITPTGWVHEQDNTKVALRSGGSAIAREMGVNEYVRITGHDFSAGEAYWSRTRDFWAGVRDAWSERMARENSVRIDTEWAGKAVMERLFELAESAELDAAARARETRAVVHGATRPAAVAVARR